MQTNTLWRAFLLFFILQCGIAQSQQSIPSQYQDAYTTMSADIQSFATTVNAAWDGSPWPVLHSSQLQTANSDLTTNLLKPYYYQMTVLSELNSLQALGSNAITFHINFPAMYEPYYADPSEYQAYLGFYTQLVSEIRGRGLKVIIETTIAVVYPGNNSEVFIPYYQSLDWPTYETQRVQLATSIAQLFHPDYLVFVAEPDTEATTTGQTNAGTVSGSAQMVQEMISSVQAAGITGVQFGAGCGTWNPSFLQFIQTFSTLPLQFVDMHVYPVNQDNLPNALAGLGMIRAAGKQPSISEMWSYKENDTEYQQALPYVTIYARDAFSFWTPLDISFLQVMSTFGTYGHFAFMTPFWSHYFAAYLDYNIYGALPDASVILQSDTASTQANMTGQFTSTGKAYENLLVASPDRQPPLVPAAPALVSYSQTVANIAWTPTTDNVGVAAYNIYRDTALIATVSSPLTYYDPTLSPKTTYSYTVAAFDAAGNLSPLSAPMTMTTYPSADTTPPSAPFNLQAISLTETTMNLTWIASVDNVAIGGYVIYRGTTPDSLAVIANSATNSFLDSNVGPGRTYYYSVSAYDTSGNQSQPSPLVSGTTLFDVTPPTTPKNLSVAVSPGPVVTISWSPSVDDYALAGYQIYRGTSASSLQIIGWTVAGDQNFVDPFALSGKTYYYAVAAVDAAKNTSPLSAEIIITTR